MSGLGASAFAEFFSALHGVPPFPWQDRLATRVLEDGRWPDVLDLPTGAGKTSALEIALLAHAADPRRHPRRILLVVDRRIVVDQVRAHAERVRQKIVGARTGVLAEVGAALRHGSDEAEPPLEVAVMRGGMPRDDGWARRPDSTVLGVSTVDQAGSRLLFRGYGVSERMSPVQAGLLGNDTLILLDEVHLAVPFAQTLLAVRDRWQARRESGLGSPWGVVQMSATPAHGAETEDVFGLGEADRAAPALAPRLEASKHARLTEVTGRGRDPDAVRERMVRACTAEARRFVSAGARAVAIVVNRVAAAREIRAALEPDAGATDLVLLTGRMRSLDREDLLGPDLLRRIGAGRRRADHDRPVIVVTTQCIEAGADLDFDALVTECASLDALRQRFGRLDRRGELGSSEASIVVSATDLDSRDPDPVYGNALRATWHWLAQRGDAVDFGIEALALPPAGALAALVAPAADAPVLLPSHLDAWAQTSPRPVPDPDIELWLHGPDRSSPEVQVVWRADLGEPLLEDALGEEPDEARERVRAALNACPPSALEALSIPIGAARAWLARAPEVEMSDLSGGGADEGVPAGGRPAVRWAGDATAVIRAREIRPGDVLVVPAAYGGIARGSWNPASGAPVTDLGDRAQWAARERPTLRLHRSVLGQAAMPGEAPEPPAEDETLHPRQVIAEWLGAHAQWLEDYAEAISLPREALDALRRRHRRIALPDGTWTLVGPRLGGRGSAEVSTEDDGASYLGRPVTLAAHSMDVRAVVQRFAAALGLPVEVGADLALAAWLHDVGKADPRFQRMLVGGSEIRLAMLEEPLAKSGSTRRDLAAQRQARQRSGYPAGARHELLSLAMLLESGEALQEANDRELVLHLVASHHGWCRPFAPVAAADPSPVEVHLTHGTTALRARSDHGLEALDSGVADRFWDLVDRYGWWGLAWLEAILRLADHRASEAEEGGA